MKLKNVGISLIMAVVLFAYGYFLSEEGHEHSDHEEKESAAELHEH